jgi:hypothetical protein
MPLRGDSTLDCKEARELTRGFLSGGGVLERRAEWRAHLVACKECDEQYRDTVEMLSRLHRARKEPLGPAPERERARELAQASETAAPPARRSLIAFSPPRTRFSWRPRKRSAWLGLALPFVLLLVFGALGLPGSEARAANALVLQGAVELDGRILAPGEAARPIQRGARIVAAADARVRLQDAHSELVFEGEGMLRCEGLGPLRVFLYGGRLQARGACTVSSAVGIVSSTQGSLQVSIEADGLHLRAGESGATFVDASGRRALAPGAELRIAAVFEPASGH